MLPLTSPESNQTDRAGPTAGARRSVVGSGLQVVPPAERPSIDRRRAPFAPLYLEIVRRGIDEQGRVGHGLRGGAALFYALLIHAQGEAADGNRFEPSADRPRRAADSAYFRRRFGFTHDELQSWSEELARAHPCGYCDRGHPLVRTEVRPGASNRYRLIRCADVAAAEAVPLALALPQKRKKTGGPSAEHVQERLFAPAGAGADEHGIMEVSDKVRGCSQDAGESERRVLALQAIALLNGMKVGEDLIGWLAANVPGSSAADLEGALLAVVARASLQRVAATAAFAEMLFRERPSEEVRGSDGDWALRRMLELARRAEPGTTPAQARAYLAELHLAIAARYPGSAPPPGALEDEVSRILTDPRVVGTPDRPQGTPVRMLRHLLKSGAIWTPAHQDAGGGKYHAAFKRLSPGVQSEVFRVFELDRDGVEPLDHARLRALGIYSPGMLSYLRTLTG